MSGVRALYHEQINKESPGRKKASNLPFERLISFLSFMTLYPFFSLFFSTLFLRTVITIIINQWILIWLFLELNIISFIPIISATRWNQEQEASLKYLLFQALGSRLLLISTVSPLLHFFLPLALTIKLGAAPFHAWFPSVIKRISWVPSTLLITWQKIAPMLLIVSTLKRRHLYIVVGVTRALVGGIGGINQTHFRPLLAYSSIGHIGWIISSATTSQFIPIFYLVMYIIISARIMLTATITNTFLIKSSKKKAHLLVYLPLSFLLLSLSGIPPLAGFIPKVIVIISIKSILVVLLLIIGSLINLYYYLRFILIILITTQHAHSLLKPVPLLLSFLLYFSVSPLPFFTLIIIII